MMRTVVTSLPYFSETGKKIAESVNGEYLPYHNKFFSENFRKTDRIIAIMAIGIVVRSIAPLISDKWQDPAIVVISPDNRFVIPVLGGHHGANALAEELAEKDKLIPVITTATEALNKEAVEVFADREQMRVVNTDSTRKSNTAVLNDKAKIYRINGSGMVIGSSGVSFLITDKPYSVGIGCRLGTTADEIKDAINRALIDSKISLDEIGIVASSELKSHESGLIEATRDLKIPLIFLSNDILNKTKVKTKSAAERFGLQGVAEPAAIAASAGKELKTEKKVYGNVTVAIAK